MFTHLSIQLPSASSEANRTTPEKPKITTLEMLRDEFAEREGLENPDIVVPTKELRFTEGEALAVPDLGTFAFTSWSKRQLASIVGVRWDRWFAKMSPGEQADEVNKRLWSSDVKLKVRSSRLGSPNGVGGTVMALVSPTFTPLADTQVLDLLSEGLRGVEPELRVVRHAVTDKTTNYVVGIGAPFQPGDDKDVGDIWGCVAVRNSGVGYAAACFIASLHRLLCKNGMTAPIPGALLLRRAHRAFDLGKLRGLLGEQLRGLPGKFADAGRALLAARRENVEDAEKAFEEILKASRLPRNLIPALTRAYEAEPNLKGTAFGISQAATRAAQELSPEDRFELERAAGEYLTRFSGTHLSRRS